MIDTELRQKYSPDGSELRRCQMRMVEMLRFFDSVCKRNGLSYWLDSGTLLGAVRHGGFIPWDDDIDVCMMRKDALVLKNLFLKQRITSNEFVLQCHETDSGYFLMWDKIRDRKSENLNGPYAHHLLEYKGLAMDVFRVDDNSNLRIWKSFDKLVKWFISYPLLDNNSIWNKFRFLVRPSFFILSRLFYRIAYLFSPFNKHYLAYSYGIPWRYEIPQDYVYPLKTIDFEGFSFSCPQKPEEYLEVLYGDWRTLPPEQARIAHKVKVRFEK